MVGWRKTAGSTRALGQVVDIPRWTPGTQVLQHDVLLGKLVTVRPQTVVRDESEVLILYSHPHAPYRSTTLTERNSIPLGERIDAILDTDQWLVEDRVSGGAHMISISPVGAWYSVWHFWDLNWEFKNSYVNFQSPFVKTSRGITVEDLTLDIKIDPDFGWSWKDEDEFGEMVRRGVISDDHVSAVDRVKLAVINLIESRNGPFEAAWREWRPDETWQVPELPSDADEIY